jgi:hypothetical protein
MSIRRRDVKISAPIPIPQEGADGPGLLHASDQPKVASSQSIRDSQSSAFRSPPLQTCGMSSYHNSQHSISTAASRESNTQRRRGSALKSVMRKIFTRARRSQMGEGETHAGEQFQATKIKRADPDMGPENGTFITVHDSIRTHGSPPPQDKASSPRIHRPPKSSERSRFHNYSLQIPTKGPRRRATLPSLLLSDEEARETVVPIVHSSTTVAASDSGSIHLDGRLRTRSIQANRRSRSASSLKDASQRTISSTPWRWCSEDINFWKSSVLDIEQDISPRPATNTATVAPVKEEIGPTEMSGLEHMSDADREPQPQSESESESVPEPEPVTEPVIEPEPVTEEGEGEAEADAEPEPELETETEMETEPEQPEPDHSSEPEAAAPFNVANLMQEADVTLEQRVITLEVKLMDLELAIAKIQGRGDDAARGGTRDKTQHGFASTQRRPSHGPLAYIPPTASQESLHSASPVMVDGRPTSISTLRAHTCRPAPWQMSSFSIPDVNSISIAQYSALITLLRREQSARKALEHQVAQLQEDLQRLVRQGVMSMTTMSSLYPTPSPDSQETRRHRLLRGSLYRNEERPVTESETDTDADYSDVYSGESPYYRTNLEMTQPRSPVSGMI